MQRTNGLLYFSNNCLSDAIELYNRFDIIVCQNPSKGNKTKKIAYALL